MKFQKLLFSALLVPFAFGMAHGQSATTIQIKRGPQSNIPTLKPGEPAVALDTGAFYVGITGGNHLINPGVGVTRPSDIGLSIVTPEQYGALADGRHDDGPAINSAAASGKEVYFASGKTYRTTITLIPAYSKTWRGGGAQTVIVFDPPSPASHPFAIECSGLNACRFQDFCLQPSVATQATTTFAAGTTPALDEANVPNGIDIPSGSYGNLFDNCVIQNFNRNIVLGNNGENRFTHCTIGGASVGVYSAGQQNYIEACSFPSNIRSIVGAGGDGLSIVNTTFSGGQPPNCAYSHIESQASGQTSYNYDCANDWFENVYHPFFVSGAGQFFHLTVRQSAVSAYYGATGTHADAATNNTYGGISLAGSNFTFEDSSYTGTYTNGSTVTLRPPSITAVSNCTGLVSHLSAGGGGVNYSFDNSCRVIVGDDNSAVQNLGGYALSGFTGLAGTGGVKTANFAGVATVTTTATSKVVNFANNETDALYGIQVTPSWQTVVSYGSKATNGFTVTFGTAAPAGAEITWMILRP